MAITALYSYNQNSEGSKNLADALGVRRIAHRNSKFIGGRGKVILNWGATELPEEVSKCTIINPSENVSMAVNKVDCFQVFRDEGVSHPEWTTSPALALQWLEDGQMVFARTQLRSHSGRGIVIMDPDHPDNWNTRAPLYVKYIKKQHEYRIHVFNGQVIDTQRKGLREELRGQPDVNFKIRNLANGFIYVRNDGHVVPDVVRGCAIAAVGSLGLTFGAADVIYNQRDNRAYALEVNTAPGLTGTTIESYATAFRRL